MYIDQWVEIRDRYSFTEKPLIIYYKGEEYFVTRIEITESIINPITEVTLSLEPTRKERVGKTSYMCHSWYTLYEDLSWHESNSANFITDEK